MALETKTYVLLEHTHSSAPIYQRVNKEQRVRMKLRPIDHAYLQLTFTDAEGKNRTLRYKEFSNHIFQDEQLEKDKIPANEKFTPTEKKAVEFRNGYLVTNKPVLQKFLEASPQFEGFTGQCYAVKRPLYRLLDKKSDIKSTNTLIKKQVEAAGMVMAMELEEAQNTMIRINGSFFKVPDNIDEAQNMLVDWVNQAEETKLDDFIAKKVNFDDETTILIGRAVAADLISFTQLKDQVAIKKGKDWVKVKQVSSEIDLEKRKDIFTEFLTSQEGKSLLDDLKKEVKKLK